MNTRWTIEKDILPAFPSTPHLPFEPNASDDDVVASFGEVVSAFDRNKVVHVEEKLDGASVGMTMWKNEPLIRNRDHILRKGYRKDTPAKKQFVPIWNWWYQHKDRFAQLEGLSVYGEWLKARHGIYYNKLPDWFVAYDLYDQDRKMFLAPQIARPLLQRVGFVVPVVRWHGVMESMEVMLALSRLPSSWSDELSEGIYLKTDDGENVTHRFKMVRTGYVRGKYWDGKTMFLNEVTKEG